jgi:hypothetical protein
MLFEPFPDLREDQLEIADDKHRFKVVACGRRWGKTTLGVLTAIREARRGLRVWWVVPTYAHAFHPWGEIKAALHDEWARKLEHHRHIELKGGGSITIKSAQNPDSLRGWGLDFVVIDEAALLAEEAWVEALRPALSDRGGRALFLSTPKGRNWFWHAWQRGNDPLNEEWKSWNFKTSDNPMIPDSEIDNVRREMAERSFKQEYEAEFTEGEGSVFHHVRDAATAPEAAQPDPAHRYMMGVDFGRYDDYTAAAVIDVTTGDMVALDRFNELDWSVQRGRIAALARAWHVESIHAEANAMGEPNIEALRSDGLPVMAFTTTRPSKKGLIEGLVAGLQTFDLRLLPDAVLLGELEAYTYAHTATGTVYTAPPGRHDDTVIALALAWSIASTPRLVFGIVDVW